MTNKEIINKLVFDIELNNMEIEVSKYSIKQRKKWAKKAKRSLKELKGDKKPCIIFMWEHPEHDKLFYQEKDYKGATPKKLKEVAIIGGCCGHKSRYKSRYN